MTDKINPDPEISRLVRSVAIEIPPAVDDRIRMAATDLRQGTGLRLATRPGLETTGEYGRSSSELCRPHSRSDEDGQARGLGRRQRPGRSRRRRFLFLALIPGAAAALLTAVLLVPALRRPPIRPISEIRTEFELVDKNIKIIFIQRPDFKLFKEN